MKNVSVVVLGLVAACVVGYFGGSIVLALSNTHYHNMEVILSDSVKPGVSQIVVCAYNPHDNVVACMAPEEFYTRYGNDMEDSNVHK